jgi:hypothetical protein
VTLIELEKEYLHLLHTTGPDYNLYLALALVSKGQGKLDRAKVFRNRAEGISGKREFLSLLGGMLAVLGMLGWVWKRNRWFWIFIPIGCQLTWLAFCDDLRYKGTVLFEQTHAFRMASNRGSVLFSFSKGSDVRIIGEDSGYLFVEYETKRGWVVQEKILSWDPFSSVVIEE